jgi:hypothetical protein
MDRYSLVRFRHWRRCPPYQVAITADRMTNGIE